MTAALLLMAALAQAPPVPECGVTMSCVTGGYLSTAGLNFGSGTPDFTAGNPDGEPSRTTETNLSKYVMMRSRSASHYHGYHGDFTFQNEWPRYNGWLLHINNKTFGGPVFWVNWRGDLWSWGNGLEVQQNGAGLWSRYSYVGLRGNSGARGVVADVAVVPYSPHLDGGWSFDVWAATYQNTQTHTRAVFRVRDDGALSIAGKTFRTDVDEADGGTTLRLTYERPDGGTTSFFLPSECPGP